jgi:nicotinate-nucleotide pyrophosphorylase (carboxylating)
VALHPEAKMNLNPDLYEQQINSIVDLALTEDSGQGDVTSKALIPTTLLGKARIQAKEHGVLAGTDIAQRVLLRTDPSLDVSILIEDGTAISPGDIIATVAGRVASILKAERVLLNFLQRLSGVATTTARYVPVTQGTNATVVDTRKTTPGFRLLEKQAVRMGGGQNHRFSLSDGILIKDNHLAALRALGMSLTDIITRAKQNAPQGLEVEVEVTTIEEAEEAAAAGADIIMLDNMDPAAMKKAVTRIARRARTEASGGITLQNIKEAAEAGVDLISVGALTHSPKALDISLEMEPYGFETP